MPYITEEIWQKTRPFIKSKDSDNASSIMVSAYPTYDEALVDKEASTQISDVQSIISALRNLRSEMNIEPSKRVNVYVDGLQARDIKLLSDHHHLIVNLAKLDSIQAIDGSINTNECASTVSGHLSLLVPLGDLIDVEEEKARLQRELDKLQKDIDKLSGQLNNPNFVERAPAAVVEKNKQDYAALIESQQQIKTQLDKIATME
jgi:Valyl-tRNA synthetase